MGSLRKSENNFRAAVTFKANGFAFFEFVSDSFRSLYFVHMLKSEGLREYLGLSNVFNLGLPMIFFDSDEQNCQKMISQQIQTIVNFKLH
jgi:hypothetical protein